MEAVQKVINFAVRVICGKRKHDRLSAARASLGWLSSRDMFNHQTMLLLHKIRHSGVPEQIAAQIVRNCERVDHVRHTRQDNLISLPRIRGTAAGKRMFTYRAAAMYNALPSEFANMSVGVFKRSLKRHLLHASDDH